MWFLVPFCDNREFANDGLKLHEAALKDQGFHRDGTDHGPTQATVRDHRPRHLIPMFYPQETTLLMGAAPDKGHSPALLLCCNSARRPPLSF